MKLFRRRLDIFMEFYRNGYFDNLHLASGYESEIVRLLDMGRWCDIDVLK